jgi:dihydropteroate synthase
MAEVVPATPAVKVMGVVNVTPDSFSDGGRHFDPAAALTHARRLIAEGADILDVGGESTRPGAAPVAEADEIARVVPLIRAIRAESDIAISVDTMKPAVARAAVEAGATMWNDVTALRWEPAGGAALAAELGCEVVLMHMQGEPRTMQAEPRYDDVVAEVADFLAARAEATMAAGVARDKIWLDPGVGFGKHMIRHNLPLLAGLERIVALGFPVLLGVSRKSFIGRLDGGADADERLGGSIAGALWGAAAGVAAVRVHDVRETVQALRVWRAIAQAGARAL